MAESLIASGRSLSEMADVDTDDRVFAGDTVRFELELKDLPLVLVRFVSGLAEFLQAMANAVASVLPVGYERVEAFMEGDRRLVIEVQTGQEEEGTPAMVPAGYRAPSVFFIPLAGIGVALLIRVVARALIPILLIVVASWAVSRVTKKGADTLGMVLLVGGAATAVAAGLSLLARGKR